MRHAIIWASSAVMLISAVTANAAPRQLKGRYAVTGSDVCLAAPGFDADYQALPPSTDQPVFIHSSSVLATRTYNGDGTGTVEGRQVNISPGLGTAPPGASSNDFSYSFTYNIDANGIFTTDMVPGSFLETILTGPGKGQTYTVDKMSFSGLISGDGKIIQTASTEPSIETVTNTKTGSQEQQICHRTRLEVLLGKESDKR